MTLPRTRTSTRITNAFTCDVEDYFQVSALAPHFPRERWDSVPCRIERNLDLVLELLDAHASCGTFFTLGWIAERFPQLVRRIADAGHEVASHGYGHQRASDLTPAAFSADIRSAKAILEDITGQRVTGYRAPSFSIGKANLWAHDCIAEAGYRYSSSVYPVRHDHYGIPDAPRFAWRLPNGLVEVPITTLRLLGRNWPAGGGGFFRLLPYAVSRWQIARVNADDKRAAIFYFHPWEIDPEQPRVTDATARTRFRHYINLKRTAARLDRLLSDFSWGRADQVFCDAA